jgi:hypothetical protein
MRFICVKTGRGVIYEKFMWKIKIEIQSKIKKAALIHKLFFICSIKKIILFLQPEKKQII